MTEKEKDILIDEIIDIARDSCNDGFNEHHALTEAEKLVERLVKKLNIDNVSNCLEFVPSTKEGLFCAVCDEHKEYHSK